MAVDLATLAIRIQQTGISQAKTDLDSLTRSGAAAEQQMAKLGSAAAALGAALVAMAAASAAAGLAMLIKQGMQFNSVMENSAIGIASMIGATQAITDEQGKMLDGAEKWGAAQELSARVMEEIKVLALETTATVPELVEGFQGIVAPASEAGVALKDMPVLAQRMAQAMAAAQIPLQQMRTEGRALLTGEIKATDILARNLNITKQDVEQWKAKGIVAQELLKRLQAFGFAGEAAAKSVSGLASNLKDAVMQISGAATAPAYESMKSTLQSILDSLVSVDKEQVKIGGSALQLKGEWQGFNELLRDTANLAAEAFDSIARGAIYAAQMTGNIHKDLKETGIPAIKEYSRELSYLTIPAPLLPIVLSMEASFKSMGITLPGLTVEELKNSSDGVLRDWESIKGEVQSVKNSWEEIKAILKGAIPVIFDISLSGMWQEAKWFLEHAGIDLGIIERRTPQAPPGPSGLVGYGTEGEELEGPKYIGLGDTGEKKREYQTKGLASGKGGKGGGGGGKDTSEQLERLVLQLREELARAADQGFGAIDAWYDKTEAKIEKLATTQEAYNEAVDVLNEVADAKEKKVEEEFLKWYYNQMGLTTKVQQMEDQAKLDSVKGRIKEEQMAKEAAAAHELDAAQRLESDKLSMARQYIDTLSQQSNEISAQISFREKSLALEKKMAELSLEQWFRGKDLTDIEKQDYRNLLARVNAIKDYNEQRKREVELGTLKGWAISRSEEASRRDTASGLMGGMENLFQNAMSAGIQGVLAHDKNTLKKVGETMVGGFIGELTKRSVTKVFDRIGEAMVPSGKKTMEATESAAMQGSVSAAAALTKAGTDLSGSSGKLTGSAGNLSGSAGSMVDAAMISNMQFGMAAGGLVLAGIGMLTGSEALMAAAMVLQMAAAALQLAVLLMKAASFLPFFQTGGIMPYTGPAIIHAGERILTPTERKRFEAGHGAGGSTTLHINIDARGAQKGIDWQQIARQKIAPEITKQIKLGRIKVG